MRSNDYLNCSHDMSFFDRVYAAVRTIPKGRVATYGQIARMIGTRDARQVGPHSAKASRGKHALNPRTVGWALHANRDQKVPCHRVVFADGSLAPGYAFGGPDEQRKRLKSEGVEFTKSGKVDLSKYRSSLT